MEVFQLLSKVADYPTNEFRGDLGSAIDKCNAAYPGAADYLKKFEDSLQDKDVNLLEEQYTRTFDIQGQCCLDIGYVLFGEDYKRGDFLVQIQRMQKENHVDTGVELPDHLTNMLKLLAVVDEQNKKDLIEKILMPAIEKMLENFPPESTGGNYYANVLRAINAVLDVDFEMDRTIFGGPVC